MLVLKLLLVPVLLLAISSAGRRWGAAVAGTLAGLPLIAGPTLLLLALERGAQFASDTASAALGALIAPAAFNLTYARAARFGSWRWALPASLGVWGMAGALVAQTPASVTLRSALTFAFLAIAPNLFPRGETSLRATLEPWSAPFARLLASVLVVLSVNVIAAYTKPVVSGLFLVFPTFACSLAVAAHRTHGWQAASELLQGMVEGFQSVAGFCLALALLLPRVHAGWAFLVATAAASLLACAAASARASVLHVRA
jgi:hypothetical protein